ncbi:hypothetical protein CHS0354_036715 [Potamilus streckersoni]|uniref:Uncharacterized protein n=1 Tax=Potamilus streckersoni TaxID=2493646 RepID=A0AAE0WBW8_9BIVA|nr:hypothetical protein CHS0354_036715 [Potamilus streckersoni]
MYPEYFILDATGFLVFILFYTEANDGILPVTISDTNVSTMPVHSTLYSVEVRGAYVSPSNHGKVCDTICTCEHSSSKYSSSVIITCKQKDTLTDIPVMETPEQMKNVTEIK